MSVRKSASGNNVHTLFEKDSSVSGKEVVYTAGTFSELDETMKAQLLDEVPTLAKVIAENKSVIQKKFDLQKSLKANSPSEQEKKRKREEEKARKKREAEELIRAEEKEKQSKLFQKYAIMKNEVHSQVLKNMYDVEVDLAPKKPVKLVLADAQKEDGKKYLQDSVQQIKEIAYAIVKLSAVEKDKRIELTTAILDLKYNAIENLGYKPAEFNEFYDSVMSDCTDFIKLKTIENGKKLCQLILKYPRLKYTSASWTWMVTNCDWLATQIESTEEEKFTDDEIDDMANDLSLNRERMEADDDKTY